MRSSFRPSFFLLALAVILLLPPSAQAARWGDLTGDDRVNVLDAVQALRAVAHLTSLSPDQFAVADVNHDHSFNVLDAVALLRHVTFGTRLAPPSPLASAHFSVDVKTRQVTVLPEPAGSSSAVGGARPQAAFLGGTVVFNSSLLLDQPGDTGRKVLEVSLANRSGETMGKLPNGTVTGVRVIFNGFTNVGSFSDLRPKVTVSTVTGTGVAGGTDGPLASATLNAPRGVGVGADGSIYVAEGAGHRIRKISQGLVSTLAGSGIAGTANGAGTAASFSNLWGLAVHPLDGSIYVTEFSAHRIRRISPQGIVTTVAGTGAAGGANGSGTTATFNQPAGIAIDATGTLYVGESAGQRVRKIVKTGGDPTLPGSYTVSTLAGSGGIGSSDGIGALASFNLPRAVAVDGSGVVYVADASNNKIRRIGANGEVVTIAGTGTPGTADGSGEAATFNSPQAIAVVNGAVVVADVGGNKLRQLRLKGGSASPASATSWTAQTLAGPAPGVNTPGSADGTGDVARFSGPRGLAADAGGNVYVGEETNHKVRKVTPANGYFPVGAASGSTSTGGIDEVQLSNADGAIPNGNRPYLVYPQMIEPGQTSAAKKWAFTIPDGVKAFEFTVTVEAATDTLAPPFARVNEGSPDVLVSTLAGSDSVGYVDGPGLQARFDAYSTAIDVDAQGILYIADSNNNAIRRIDRQRNVTTVAGGVGNTSGSLDGIGSVARFDSPTGITVNPDGTTLYVTEYHNNTVRRIVLTGNDPTDSTNWTVSTVAGVAGSVGVTLTPGTNDNTSGNNARFYDPSGITLDEGGNLYLVEESGNRVRMLQFKGGDPGSSLNWHVRLVAGSMTSTPGLTEGTGSNALFYLPTSVAVGHDGTLYVADFWNHRIRKITNAGSPTGGTVSTFAGSTQGYGDGAGNVAMFSTPIGVTVDSAGYLFVNDRGNRRVRRVSPSGEVTTVAGTGVQGGDDGPGDVATFNHFGQLTITASGDLYTAEGWQTPRIRLIQRVLK